MFLCGFNQRALKDAKEPLFFNQLLDQLFAKKIKKVFPLLVKTHKKCFLCVFLMIFLVKTKTHKKKHEINTYCDYFLTNCWIKYVQKLIKVSSCSFVFLWSSTQKTLRNTKETLIFHVFLLIAFYGLINCMQKYQKWVKISVSLVFLRFHQKRTKHKRNTISYYILH